MHLSHVLAGDDLDDIPLVVGRVKASATAALSIAGDGSAPSQRVLPMVQGKQHTGEQGGLQGEREAGKESEGKKDGDYLKSYSMPDIMS